jgi:hypothetical protein
MIPLDPRGEGVSKTVSEAHAIEPRIASHVEFILETKFTADGDPIDTCFSLAAPLPFDIVPPYHGVFR